MSQNTSTSTYICMLSGQPAANLLPIFVDELRPSKVIMLVTNEMKSQADALRLSINQAFPSIRIEENIEIPDAYDLDGIYEIVFNLLDSMDIDERNNCVLNATGGTKIMMSAAMSAFHDDENTKIIYMRSDNGNIIFLNKKSKNKKQQSKYAIPLKTYFKAYGSDFITNSSKTLHFTQDKKDLCNDIINTESYRKSLPQINKLASQAQKGLAVSYNTLPENTLTEAGEALLDKLSDANLLSIKKNTIIFPNEESRFFVCGGWLEDYVYDAVRKLGVKPEKNIILKNFSTDSSDLKNEIDVCFWYGNSPVFIECKTMKMGNEKPKEILYKLDSIASNLGGLSAKRILVSFQPLEKETRDYAENRNIYVIDGRDLKDNLTKLIENYLQKK